MLWLSRGLCLCSSRSLLSFNNSKTSLFQGQPCKRHLLGARVSTLRSALLLLSHKALGPLVKHASHCMTSDPVMDPKGTLLTGYYNSSDSKQQRVLIMIKSIRVTSAQWVAQVQQPLDSESKAPFNIPRRVNASILFECSIPLATAFKK